MPVYQETANADRDLRILPSRELPLPRLSSKPVHLNGKDDKYEVVVIGVSDKTCFQYSHTLTGYGRRVQLE